MEQNNNEIEKNDGNEELSTFNSQLSPLKVLPAGHLRPLPRLEHRKRSFRTYSS